MKEIGIAVVGLGSIARTHISALRALPAVRNSPIRPVLRTLLTRRPDEVAAEAAAMGFDRVTASLTEVLADPSVDVIDVCTPNVLHAPVVLAALAAGKGVYCEKPLASCAADAEQMAAAAAGATDCCTQVALVYRYHPVVMKMKALLELGVIGQVLQFKATYNHSGYLNPSTVKGWRTQGALSGGGGLLDLGVHIIDLLHLLVGPLELEHSTVRTLVGRRLMAPGGELQPVDVDDWALLHVHTPAGVPGVVETSRVALGNEQQTIELYGSQGSIIANLERDLEPRVQLFNGSVPALPAPAALQFLPQGRLSLGGFVDRHQACLYHYLLRCAGQDPAPGWAPTFADELNAERLVYQALAK